MPPPRVYDPQLDALRMTRLLIAESHVEIARIRRAIQDTQAVVAAERHGGSRRNKRWRLTTCGAGEYQAGHDSGRIASRDAATPQTLVCDLARSPGGVRRLGLGCRPRHPWGNLPDSPS